MISSRRVGPVALLAFLATVVVYAQVQEPVAAAHAKGVVELLQTEKFEDVTKEFNAQMAAALSASQLRDVWSTLRQQVGPF